MQSDFIAPLPLDVAGQPAAWWRRALAGLTPQTLAIVAALLFIRALTTTIENLVQADQIANVEAWFQSFYGSYRVLLAQSAPMLLVVIATANLGPQHGPKRIAALIGAVILSAGAAALPRIFWWPEFRWEKVASMLTWVWPRYAILGGMLTFVAEFYRVEVTNIGATQQAEIDRAAFETEMSEARLQVLQAQIEPHFLFNTLANARRLYAEDHALGRAMLESLMRYLEMTLPQMRNSESTIQRDSMLVEAFLNIQRIRMGQRLTFSIDIPAELSSHRVPSMMLLTLVENAVKHGISRSPHGGLIRVVARTNDNRLTLSVADTGIGFASASGPGIGLANISARLAAEFGDRAGLTLENNEFGGATATIVLPLEETKRHP